MVENPEIISTVLLSFEYVVVLVEFVMAKTRNCASLRTMTSITLSDIFPTSCKLSSFNEMFFFDDL